MAIYPYKCSECGKQEEVVQSIASYCVAPRRPVCCGAEMPRVLVPLMVVNDSIDAPFRSMIDGELIDSKSGRNAHMAKHGVVLYDDIAPEIERKRQQRAIDAIKDLRGDLVESMHKVEAGHKPVVIPEAEIIPTV